MSSRGLGTRTEDKLNYFSLAVNKAIEEEVDLFVIGGDIFDKINPPEKLRVAFLDLVGLLLSKRIYTAILIGNHDTDLFHHNLMGEGSFVKKISTNSPLYLVNPYLAFNFLGLDLLFISWTNSDDRIKQIIKENPAHFIFGHFGVSGAQASGTEYHITEGIDPNLLTRHIYTFLGHYHRFQYTEHYAFGGSIARVDMGERDDPKGFIFFQVTKDQFSWDFIDINDRKFIDLKFEDPEPVKLDLDVQGAVVKVTCEGSDAWLIKEDVTTIPNRLYSAGAYKVVHQFIHRNDKVSASIEYYSRKDYSKMVKDYAETLERSDLVDLGLSILYESNTCDSTNSKSPISHQ